MFEFLKRLKGRFTKINNIGRRAKNHPDYEPAEEFIEPEANRSADRKHSKKPRH